jgi:hypothetical protein
MQRCHRLYSMLAGPTRTLDVVRKRRCALPLVVRNPLTASGHTSASETSSSTSAAEPWLQRWAAAVASRSSTVASSPAAASKSFNAAIAALTATTAVPSAVSRLQPWQPWFQPPCVGPHDALC